jgi:hypothetical protein
MVGIATTALIDDMLTIEPAMLFALIERAACWVARKTPTTLMSMTFRKFSSVVSRKGSWDRNPGAVDENGYWAVLCLDRPEHVGDRVRIAQVANDSVSHIAQAHCGRLHLIRLHVREYDEKAVAQQRLSAREPDTLRRACNERDFFLPHHRCPSCSFQPLSLRVCCSVDSRFRSIK